MPQPYTEARKKANEKWNAENLDRISIAMPKGKKDVIKNYIASTGETMNAFINRAIDEAMKETPRADSDQ